MKIALGSDHAGLALKIKIKTLLEAAGHAVEDFGTQGNESVDYPDFARVVAERVAAGGAERGVLVCGTGQGMAMTANKVAGVRCAVGGDFYSAYMSRLHNDSNVLALGARVIGEGAAEEIVKIWLATPFEGGRHQKRVDKIRG